MIEILRHQADECPGEMQAASVIIRELRHVEPRSERGPFAPIPRMMNRHAGKTFKHAGRHIKIIPDGNDGGGAMKSGEDGIGNDRHGRFGWLLRIGRTRTAPQSTGSNSSITKPDITRFFRPAAPPVILMRTRVHHEKTRKSEMREKAGIAPLPSFLPSLLKASQGSPRFSRYGAWLT